MTLIRLVSSIFAISLLFSSCGDDSGRLLNYRKFPSAFTVRFDSADGEVVCECRSEHCFLSAEGRPVRMNREYPSFYETLSKFAEK